MFLGGLWHGASWNFVIWGLLHGAYLVVHKIISNKFLILRDTQFFSSRIGKVISILIVQYFVFLAWIPFRVSDLDGMLYSVRKYILLDLQPTSFFEIFSQHRSEVSILGMFIILNFLSYRRPKLIENISNLKLAYWIIILIIIMLLILFFYDGNPEDFIYFRF